MNKFLPIIVVAAAASFVSCKEHKEVKEEVKKAEEKSLRKIFLVFFVGALVFAAILNLTGCAKPLNQEATKAYTYCLVAKAKQVDDGRSDAQTIAFAIQNSCLSELSQVGDFSAKARQQAALNAVLYARTHP